MNSKQTTPVTTLAQLLRRAPLEDIGAAEARRRWVDHRLRNGYDGYTPILTPPTGNPKFAASDRWEIYGLTLAQARLSGSNVCPNSTPECRRFCLGFAGRGGLSSTQHARVVRTQFLWDDPDAFISLVASEIRRAARKHGRNTAIRLNVLSDIPWEHIAPWLFTDPVILENRVMFFDYTKNATRATDETLPWNYDLTYSASERDDINDIARMVRSWVNVAVVFNGDLPRTYGGFPVIDGTVTDARFTDPRRVIVGLKPKGALAKHDSEFKKGRK